MGFYKLREWVGTVTGKGDRWEGDREVGLSPPLECQHHRTPSTNLHCTTGGRPTSSAADVLLRGRPTSSSAAVVSSRPVPVGSSAGCVCLQRPSSAGCVCLLAFAMPCLLPSSFAPWFNIALPPLFISMCARIVVASCTDCPVGSYNTGLQWRPVRRF